MAVLKKMRTMNSSSMAVGLAGKTADEQIVGFLHDIVEDTDWTFEMFEERGFPKRVIDALRYMERTLGKDFHRAG